MENGSLSSMVHSFGTFPESIVAGYIEQVLRGLMYLHGEGVVHRDIKVCSQYREWINTNTLQCANILLSHDGVKLAGMLDIIFARLLIPL